MKMKIKMKMTRSSEKDKEFPFSPVLRSFRILHHCIARSEPQTEQTPRLSRWKGSAPKYSLGDVGQESNGTGKIMSRPVVLSKSSSCLSCLNCLNFHWGQKAAIPSSRGFQHVSTISRGIRLVSDGINRSILLRFFTATSTNVARQQEADHMPILVSRSLQNRIWASQGNKTWPPKSSKKKSGWILWKCHQGVVPKKYESQAFEGGCYI